MNVRQPVQKFGQAFVIIPTGADDGGIILLLINGFVIPADNTGLVPYPLKSSTQQSIVRVGMGRPIILADQDGDALFHFQNFSFFKLS
jgi:hypothetical protein